MHLLSLSFDDPAANLALDEALLDAHAAGQLPAGGVLRVWESPRTVVVVGRGTRLADEVRLENCANHGVPVLRRVSGGMSIVAGRGCLMYAVIAGHPVGGKADIDATHQHVLGKLTKGLRGAGLPVEVAGTSDLALVASDGALRKVSGNSLRMARQSFLYHGTLLYDFPLATIAHYLREPPRSPDYRERRQHTAFVANLPIDRESLAVAVAQAWSARENLVDWPRQQMLKLVQTRYRLDDWNASR